MATQSIYIPFIEKNVATKMMVRKMVDFLKKTPTGGPSNDGTKISSYKLKTPVKMYKI